MYIMSAVSLASMAPCNIMYVYMYIMVPSCFAQPVDVFKGAGGWFWGGM